jgi:hypothetical protein
MYIDPGESLFSGNTELLEELANYKSGFYWLGILNNGHTPLKLLEAIKSMIFIIL